MATEEDTAPLNEAGPPLDALGFPEPAATTPAAQLPPVIGGKYRPLRLIARGGMGAVYEVVHLNTGEHLALKLMLARSLLTPELIERFRREARVHSSVKSEHVVRIVDADVARELEETPFLVMELLTGEDLERLSLAREPTPGEVVDWMRQLAPPLDKAHREGIVHRDLKPENLFLAAREGLPPIVKILDFGIAKMASEVADHSTATGQILGTPRYMAPEQAIGAKTVSAAVDRFALGLIAFRLLCRRHYFSGDNWVSLLREVGRGPVTRPSQMGSNRGPAFDAWFARACAFHPADRFATVVEEVEALAEALEGAAAPKRPRRAVRLWGASAGACGLLLLAWGVHGHRRAATPGRAAPLGPQPLLASPEPPPTPTTTIAPSQMPPVPEPRQTASLASRPHHPPDGAARPGARLAKSAPPKPLPETDRIWDEP